MQLFFPEKYYLFYALALLAEILGTVSGFGSSILFVPLASYFFEFHEVLGITALFHVFSNISKIILFKEGLEKHIVINMGISAVIFVVIGAFMSKYAPVKELEILLSIFLLAISIFMIIKKDSKVAATQKNLLIGGSLSGLVAGLIGTGGAIRGITLAAFHIEKNAFISTSAMIDFGVDSSRLLVYIYNGFVKIEFLYMLPVLLGVSIIGSWGGKYILSFISEIVFKRIVLILIIVIAILQLSKTIMQN